MSTFNFKEVKVSENVSFLQPGQYLLSITDAKYVKPEGKRKDKFGKEMNEPKTPYLEVTFAGKAGKVSANLYITPKAFERLQYMYTQWFEKECDKEFDSLDAIGAFFEKAFSHEKTKKIMKRVIVGGKTSEQGKVFAELPFKNFVIPDSAPEFTEGAFEQGSGLWMFYVKPSPVTPATGSNSVVLGGAPTRTLDTSYDDDLPF